MSDDMVIRMVTVDDAAVIVHHRHAMFFDMGHTDPAALGAMDAPFAPYVARRIMTEIVEWRAQGMWAATRHASKFGRRLCESMSVEPTNEMRLTLI